MTSQIDTQFLESFCDRWLEAWNSHNTQQVLNLLHKNIEWDDRVFWPKVIHGHTEVTLYTDKIWEIMHNVKFEEMQRFYAPDSNKAIVLFRQYGDGPKKLPDAGKFDTHGCDIFLNFEDGKLQRYLASYDIVEMMQQMKIIPERKDKIGGAYLMSLMRS